MRVVPQVEPGKRDYAGQAKADDPALPLQI
jgi:hypothetical protein